MAYHLIKSAKKKIKFVDMQSNITEDNNLSGNIISM
jgi:hypothetical protein